MSTSCSYSGRGWVRAITPVTLLFIEVFTPPLFCARQTFGSAAPFSITRCSRFTRNKNTVMSEHDYIDPGLHRQVSSTPGNEQKETGRPRLAVRGYDKSHGVDRAEDMPTLSTNHVPCLEDVTGIHKGR